MTVELRGIKRMFFYFEGDMDLCKDRSRQCDIYSGLGGCDEKYGDLAYALENCCKTCNLSHLAIGKLCFFCNRAKLGKGVC